MANFDTVYSQAPLALKPREYKGPVCKPSNDCFIASHVTPQTDFLINTYLLQPDRKYSPAGAIHIREGTLCKNN